MEWQRRVWRRCLSKYGWRISEDQECGLVFHSLRQLHDLSGASTGLIHLSERPARKRRSLLNVSCTSSCARTCLPLPGPCIMWTEKHAVKNSPSSTEKAWHNSQRQPQDLWGLHSCSTEALCFIFGSHTLLTIRWKPRTFSLEEHLCMERGKHFQEIHIIQKASYEPPIKSWVTEDLERWLSW